MDQENNNMLKRSTSQISQGSLLSGIDYGVVSNVPTPPMAPPMPGSNLVTHFPSLSKDEMTEKKRVSIINTGTGKHSLSSNINIVLHLMLLIDIFYLEFTSKNNFYV